jgi:septal ring factor EnvC (AmiA/AmiB activator)
LVFATAATAAPSDQLQELRDRIGRLQRQLAESEGSKTEATDALRASERSISDANRRLFQLAARSREAKATRLRLEASGLERRRAPKHSRRCSPNWCTSSICPDNPSRCDFC